MAVMIAHTFLQAMPNLKYIDYMKQKNARKVKSISYWKIFTYGVHYIVWVNIANDVSSFVIPMVSYTRLLTLVGQEYMRFE